MPFGEWDLFSSGHYSAEILLLNGGIKHELLSEISHDPNPSSTPYFGILALLNLSESLSA